jgi:hypothetical protein
MHATAKGKIIKKVQSDSDSVAIKLELPDYQTMDLIYNPSSVEFLPDMHQWVHVEYDETTRSVHQISPIQEPELSATERERETHSRISKPVTKTLAIIAAIFGASLAPTPIWFTPDLLLIFLVLFIVFAALAVIASTKDL